MATRKHNLSPLKTTVEPSHDGLVNVTLSRHGGDPLIPDAETPERVAPSIDPLSHKWLRQARGHFKAALADLRSARDGLDPESARRREGVDQWSHHLLIRQGLDGFTWAGTALAQIGPLDPVAYEFAEPALEELLGLEGLVRLAAHVTRQDGELPGAGDNVANPLREALRVAIDGLDDLTQRLDSFLASVRTSAIPGYAPAGRAGAAGPREASP